ncbi:hypothetical protein B9479_007271 [Cryptococcus floricola]|uniref:Mitochondrial carrier n=1 Tax=Cryptococcus floricola TaxID=2591691 RepID=A0A5D3AR07_9TREE|nr:hypothetical protein B9479_007271 [Cryptococcus floricola]
MHTPADAAAATPHGTPPAVTSVDHAVAGLGAGTVATLVMHPLDLVKVRFQLANSASRVASSSSGSTGGLQRHVSKPRFGTGVFMALRDAVQGALGLGDYIFFCVYNMIKKEMQGGDPAYKTSSGQHLLAAAEASAITAMMTNPIWVVKTRVFGTAKNDPAAYRGLWDGLTSIYAKEGLRGLYKGSLLALVGVSNGSIQFAAYEEIKRRRTEVKKRLFELEGKTWGAGDEKLSNIEYILASGSSKLVAIALTYPYQVVRARVQNFSPTPTLPKTPPLPHLISSIFRQEGFLAFYKGLGTNALRILPGTCTTFVVYENLVWGFRRVAARNGGEEELK